MPLDYPETSVSYPGLIQKKRRNLCLLLMPMTWEKIWLIKKNLLSKKKIIKNWISTHNWVLGSMILNLYLEKKIVCFCPMLKIWVRLGFTLMVKISRNWKFLKILRSLNCSMIIVISCSLMGGILTRNIKMFFALR